MAKQPTFIEFETRIKKSRNIFITTLVILGIQLSCALYYAMLKLTGWSFDKNVIEALKDKDFRLCIAFLICLPVVAGLIPCLMEKFDGDKYEK